jgi:hypothetical protein
MSTKSQPTGAFLNIESRVMFRRSPDLEVTQSQNSALSISPLTCRKTEITK